MIEINWNRVVEILAAQITVLTKQVALSQATVEAMAARIAELENGDGHSVND